MRHSKRTKLKTSDLNQAFHQCNIEVKINIGSFKNCNLKNKNKIFLIFLLKEGFW